MNKLLIFIATIFLFSCSLPKSTERIGTASLANESIDIDLSSTPFIKNEINDMDCKKYKFDIIVAHIGLDGYIENSEVLRIYSKNDTFYYAKTINSNRIVKVINNSQVEKLKDLFSNIIYGDYHIVSAQGSGMYIYIIRNNENKFILTGLYSDYFNLNKVDKDRIKNNLKIFDIVLSCSN